jgi:hypothetical protein
LGGAVGVVCDTKLLLHIRLRSFVFLVVVVVLFSYRLPSIDATNARCLITFHFVHLNPANPFAAFCALRSICILNGNHSLRKRGRRGTGTGTGTGSSVSILRKELDGKKAQKVLETKAL